MANQIKTNTSTQIRNFYSDGHAYMNLSFFNTNLSIKMQPFLSKNNIGVNQYDTKKAQTTTISYDSASLLDDLIEKIVDKNEALEGIVPIPCGIDAKLEFERKMTESGIIETWLHLSKNNITISYLFPTQIINVKINGQMSQQVIETGLRSFRGPIKGYLEGINADRHLNKLTDDFAKAQQQSNGGSNNNRGGNNYQGNNNGYKKPYYNNNGNNGGYKKPYYNNNGGNNNGNYNRNNNNWNPPKQQDMSTYQINN